MGWDHLIYSVQTGKTGFERRTVCRSSTTSRNIPRTRRYSARRWSASIARSLQPSPPLMIFQTLIPLSTSAERPATCFRPCLSLHAGPRGILFDRPHVVKDAPVLLDAKGVRDRITIESGDFFTSVPGGADAYILSHIIHDWGEERCLTILGHVRKAMDPASRLLIVEMVLPPGDIAHPGKMLDMVMLVQLGGQERTESEYASLLSKAGFRLTQVVPTDWAVSIVEAVAA